MNLQDDDDDDDDDDDEEEEEKPAAKRKPEPVKEVRALGCLQFQRTRHLRRFHPWDWICFMYTHVQSTAMMTGKYSSSTDLTAFTPMYDTFPLF